MSETTQRRLPFLPFLVLLLALGPTVGARPGTPPRPAATPLATPTATVPVGWPEVERLIGEQKFAEALSAVESLEAAARQAGDAAGWTKALIRATQLRIGLHGYETAVRALREASWPDDAASRAALDLCYAHALTTYLDAYSWEIHRREAVASTGPLDLESWTAAMITAEAEGAYLEVWQRRAALGTTPVTSLAEVLEPNSYPVEVRGTLRDAVSYLYAALLADTSGWTPEQENELFRLDLARLLADGPATGAVTADAAVHPLSRLVAVLADLERWHHDGRRPAAALEARLERTRRLHAALSDDDDRRAIRADLERRLDAYRGEPWWAEGMAVLAELTATDPAADALVRARELAQAGLDAYRGTPGGLHCESIVAGIGAPAVEVRSMAADGPQRRSLEVTHKNLKELHFRAYADDLVRRLETSDDYNLLPDADDIRRLVDGATPVASWKVNLPATPDFREHRSFVTPPLSAPGFYVLVAAPDPALSGVRGPVVATTLLVSDLVLLSRTTADGAIEARVVAGASGVPQGGVRVDLYRRDWQRGHRAAASATTGADGWVGFPLGSLDEGRSYFLLARRGAQVALDSDGYWLSRPGRPTRETAALLFTDRSIYRPGQRLFWKVLAWQGDRETGKLRTAAGEVVTVTLRDANGEEVTNRSVTTSSFGSASGDFELPAGRLLGGWRLDSTLGGGVVVRVEEYKRPTFEVEVADPSTPLRLNREARLVGTARYYFGLPVTEGGVRWRVVREPVWPRWWWWWGERKAPQTVAAGTARLDADGAFAVVFTPAADERLGREVSYRYLLSADVTDAGGETRSATRSFRLGFVAVEASVSAARGFFTAGEPVELVVSRASLDGQPRPGSGSWTLVGLRQPARPLLPADLPPRRSRPT
ncbi:MAG: hypothetical protein H6Q02_516, partial [Acidobacteria bacterium]|nr:hypothetical protein [Acidobacteriota bacterium]